jgi:hypothetical protein
MIYARLRIRFDQDRVSLRNILGLRAKTKAKTNIWTILSSPEWFAMDRI